MLEPQVLLANLKDIAESLGRRSVLIPVDDASSIFAWFAIDDLCPSLAVGPRWLGVRFQRLRHGATIRQS
jgi:hypothetical protein